MKILLTCGVGDFLAIEAHVAPHERDAVRVVHWATRQREALAPLVSRVFRCATHKVERDQWGAAFTRSFCISSRAELAGLDPRVQDFSIKVIIEQVRKGLRAHHGSALAKQTLADVSRLCLPSKYVVVHPYSENARTPIRDLTLDEWRDTIRAARRARLPVVVVNKGGDRMPAGPDVVDLTDELTLEESIEVVKGADAFVGAASVFSVVAAKALPYNRLWIKGSADLRKNFAWFYYAPHTTNGFVYQKLDDRILAAI